MTDSGHAYFVGVDPDVDEPSLGCMGCFPIFFGMALIAFAFVALGEAVGAETLVGSVILAGIGIASVGGAYLLFRSFNREHKDRREDRKREKIQEKARPRVLRVTEVDEMTGPQFEEFLAALYRHQGKAVEEIGGSGDMGADLIVGNTAVQAKQRSDPISRRAVSDVATATDYYDCENAVVVATSYFTSDAKELASSLGVRLIDREDLADQLANNRRFILDRLSLESLQNFEPSDFEWFTYRFLLDQGWKDGRVVGGSGDMGCDVLATNKDGETVAVQAKRYRGTVSRRAVSDAAAATKHFEADSSMVVTTGRFSQDARDLARSVGCKLVDGEDLADWLSHLQR